MPGFFRLFFTSGTLLPRILNTQRAHNNQQFTETALYSQPQASGPALDLPAGWPFAGLLA